LQDVPVTTDEGDCWGCVKYWKFEHCSRTDRINVGLQYSGPSGSQLLSFGRQQSIKIFRSSRAILRPLHSLQHRLLPSVLDEIRRGTASIGQALLFRYDCRQKYGNGFCGERHRNRLHPQVIQKIKGKREGR
jgi:hypothetical protein